MRLEQEAFEREVGSIDVALAGRKMPIPARPLQATIAILNAHQVSGPLFHPRGSRSFHFPVTAANLCDHVGAWYERRYGNRLKIDPSPGRFPLFINGGAYQCRLPLLVGEFMLVAAKGRFVDKSIVNAVDHISDLTEEVRARLTGQQENEIQVMFFICLEVARELQRQRASTFLKSAGTDSRLSCDLLCGYNANASLSAWHSLQFAEKVLKHYIARTTKPSFTHDIHKLVRQARAYGYLPDSTLNLELFNFGASVRYNPEQIDVENAISINHESWRLAFNVLRQSIV